MHYVHLYCELAKLWQWQFSHSLPCISTFLSSLLKLGPSVQVILLFFLFFFITMHKVHYNIDFEGCALETEYNYFLSNASQKKKINCNVYKFWPASNITLKEAKHISVLSASFHTWKGLISHHTSLSTFSEVPDNTVHRCCWFDADNKLCKIFCIHFWAQIKTWFNGFLIYWHRLFT